MEDDNSAVLRAIIGAIIRQNGGSVRVPEDLIKAELEQKPPTRVESSRDEDTGEIFFRLRKQ